MKTADEIKKGIECCMCDPMERRCEKCPYADGGCERMTCEKDLGDDALALTQQLKAQVPKWISVEERLPNKIERVLVTDGMFVCEAWLSLYGSWMRIGSELRIVTPTHWMPMPEPPKEDD